MTIEALLRLRFAQCAGEGGEDERLTEGIELEKRAFFLSQTLRDAVPEAAALSLLANLYRKMGRSAEANGSEQRAGSTFPQICHPVANYIQRLQAKTSRTRSSVEGIYDPSTRSYRKAATPKDRTIIW